MSQGPGIQVADDAGAGMDPEQLRQRAQALVDTCGLRCPAQRPGSFCG
jgi:hypothetical protein